MSAPEEEPKLCQYATFSLGINMKVVRNVSQRQHVRMYKYVMSEYQYVRIQFLSLGTGVNILQNSSFQKTDSEKYAPFLRYQNESC